MARATVFALAVGLFACPDAWSGADPVQTTLPDGFWARWGDGLAEVSGYALTQPRYGQLRQGEAVLVFVTETMTQEQHVKSDGGHKDELPVMKLNDIRDFQTGVYDYQVMSSVFVRLDGALPLGVATKISTSVQEWCGHTWSQLVVDPGAARHVLHSYFDGEADQDETVELRRGGVMADTLPIVLRGLAGDLVAPGQSVNVPYLPTLTDGRLNHKNPTWTEARIERSEASTIFEVPAGTYQADTWTVTVKGGDITRWYVGAAEPHLLLGWSRSDGEEAVLRGSQRLAYWNNKKEGDEALRGKLGLPAHTWPGKD